jgi:large subunit ribosomal protein L13
LKKIDLFLCHFLRNKYFCTPIIIWRHEKCCRLPVNSFVHIGRAEWLGIRQMIKNSSYNLLKFKRVDTLSYKTISANKETVNKEWVVVDATDQVLGRLCTKVAKLLRGKYKPNYTPHVDCGDNVIIVNADKVRLTGKKWTERVYYTYTGYPGGQREHTPASIMAKPNGAEKLVRRVVKGMLPKNRLGAKLLGNMYVYEGSEHKHEAQSPKAIDINLYK